MSTRARRTKPGRAWSRSRRPRLCDRASIGGRGASRTSLRRFGLPARSRPRVRSRNAVIGSGRPPVGTGAQYARDPAAVQRIFVKITAAIWAGVQIPGHDELPLFFFDGQDLEAQLSRWAPRRYARATLHFDGQDPKLPLRAESRDAALLGGSSVDCWPLDFASLNYSSKKKRTQQRTRGPKQRNKRANSPRSPSDKHSNT